MIMQRVGSSVMSRNKGSYIVYATPLDGSEGAYRIKGQPKGMSYVEAYDFGEEYKKTHDVAIDINYKGAK